MTADALGTEPRALKFPRRHSAAIAAVATAFCLVSAARTSAQECSAFTGPSVTAERRGNEVSLYVEVSGPHDVTVTISLSLTNMRSDRQTPYTATYRAGTRRRAMVLRPIAEDIPWWYRYRYHWAAGSLPPPNAERHDYALPFAADATVRVLQGPHGSFSHAGKHAWDWDLDEGSPVMAARDGTVAAACDRHEKGGGDIAYAQYNNYVYIQHADGSIAAYLHLKPASLEVTTGDRVREGDRIAASGNTGFSTRPHLHFEVFHIDRSLERVTLPVRFRTSRGIVSPQQNAGYRKP